MISIVAMFHVSEILDLRSSLHIVVPEENI